MGKNTPQPFLPAHTRAVPSKRIRRNLLSEGMSQPDRFAGRQRSSLRTI